MDQEEKIEWMEQHGFKKFGKSVNFLKQLDSWLTLHGFKKQKQCQADLGSISYIKEIGNSGMFLLAKFLVENGLFWETSMRITLNDKTGHSLAWSDPAVINEPEDVDKAVDQLLQSASDRLQQTLLTIAEYRMTGM